MKPKYKYILNSLFLNIALTISFLIFAYDTSAQVSGNWGKVDTDWSFLFDTASVSNSGISPNLSGMKITGIRIYGQVPSGSANMRMAVYTGGAADNDPTGATLLWDAGQTTVDASAGLHWIEIMHRTNVDPCDADFDCDGDVDGSDAQTFKLDFGRGEFNEPCPPCVPEEGCIYQ